MNLDAQDVTIYVPCFNAEQTILECLEGLFAQSVTPACVVVIDDCSAEPVASIPGVRVVRHDKNKGLAAARNTALSICRTPLIASVDSDVVAEDTWLESLVEAINSGPYSGVGGMMVEKHVETLGDKWRAAHMSQHWGDLAEENPRFLYGCNTLFRSSALRDAGGYDERHRTNDEDRQISEALMGKGKKLLYTPRARCRHLRKDNAASVIGSYWRWHHMRGVRRGDFASGDGMRGRIQDVNFGISCYRFDLDRKNNREELFALDFVIPWVFCARDIEMYRVTTGRSAGDFPVEELSEGFGAGAQTVLRKLVGKERMKSGQEESWFQEYVERFKTCLEEYRNFLGFDPYAEDGMWKETRVELVDF